MLHGKRLGCDRFDLASPALPGFSGREFSIDADGFGGMSHTRLKLRLIQLGFFAEAFVGLPDSARL